MIKVQISKQENSHRWRNHSCKDGFAGTFLIRLDISAVFGHVSGYLLGQRSIRQTVTRCLGKKRKSLFSAFLELNNSEYGTALENFLCFFFFSPIFIHKDGILQQGRFSLLGTLIIFILGNYFPH